MTSRAAVTLVELLVSLAILALLATVAAPAWAPSRTAAPGIAARIAAARTRAVEAGRDTVLLVVADSAIIPVRIRPDGSVIAPPVLGLDRWTGRRFDDTTFREPRP